MKGQEEGWWRTDHWYKLLGAIVGASIIAEGAVALLFLAPIFSDIGGFLNAVIAPFGLHLIIIGLFVLLFWLLKDRTMNGRKIFGHWIFSTLLLLAGMLLLVEAIGLAYYTGSHYSSTHVRGFWIAGASGQLLLLGALIIFGWLSKNLNQVRTGWSRVVAYVCSSIIAGEGLFIIGVANNINLDGTDISNAGTVSLLGLQLLVLGGGAAFLWGFKDKVLFRRKPFSHWLLSIIPLLFTEILAIEGLILVGFSRPLDIEGIGGIRGFWSAAAGAQLFFLGTLASAAWLWIEKQHWETKPAAALGVGIGTLLMSQGLFVIGVSSSITVESIGGILERTMDLAGAQLFVLGGVVTLFWGLKDRRMLSRYLCENRLISLVPLVVGGLVAMEGLIVIAYASPVTLEGVGVIRPAWMVLAGSGLFLLGGWLVLAWYWRDRTPSEGSITRIAGPIIALVIMAEGLFIMGIAGTTHIDGIGGVLGRTVTLAGGQLFLLGILLLGMRLLKGRSVFAKEVMGVQVSEAISYLALALVAVEGLVITGLAANIFIQDFGGVSGIYVMLGGVQLFFLALLHMTFWVWRYDELPKRRRRDAIMGIIFLLLLLPPALVL